MLQPAGTQVFRVAFVSFQWVALRLSLAHPLPVLAVLAVLVRPVALQVIVLLLAGIPVATRAVVRRRRQCPLPQCPLPQCPLRRRQRHRAVLGALFLREAFRQAI